MTVLVHALNNSVIIAIEIVVMLVILPIPSLALRKILKKSGVEKEEIIKKMKEEAENGEEASTEAEGREEADFRLLLIYRTCRASAGFPPWRKGRR